MFPIELVEKDLSYAVKTAQTNRHLRKRGNGEQGTGNGNKN